MLWAFLIIFIAMASLPSVVSHVTNIADSAKVWRPKLSEVAANGFQQLAKSNPVHCHWLTFLNLSYCLSKTDIHFITLVN
jgi:hypothetical protein